MRFLICLYRYYLCLYTYVYLFIKIHIVELFKCENVVGLKGEKERPDEHE